MAECFPENKRGCSIEQIWQGAQCEAQSKPEDCKPRLIRSDLLWSTADATVQTVSVVVTCLVLIFVLNW